MSPAALPTPAPLWLRIAQNPLSRIIIFLALYVGFAWLISKAMPIPSLKHDQALQVTGAELWLRALRDIVPCALAYWILVRLVERRPVSELAPRKALSQGAVGWLVGMGIMLLTAAVMAAGGWLTVNGANPEVYLLGPLLVLGIVPGITEEIVTRGILFRVVEDGLGTWIALAISAAFFGLAHYANPNATAWSSIAIAIEAGLLLGMAYAWTRSLWFCMGLHAAWNFTQGPLLGIPVSGIHLEGWLQSSTQGPELLSGGAFGAEASLITVAVCVSLAGYFTRRAIAAGQIKAPFWTRRRAARAAIGLESTQPLAPAHGLAPEPDGRGP